MNDDAAGGGGCRTIAWSERLALGIPEIDEQHRMLIAIHTDLVRSLRDEAPAAATLRALERLSDYAVHHFRTEEELMQTARYAGFEAHKREHDNFSTVLHLLSRRRPGDPATLRDIAAFLADWILHHVTETDGGLRALTGTDGGLSRPRHLGPVDAGSLSLPPPGRGPG